MPLRVFYQIFFLVFTLFTSSYCTASSSVPQKCSSILLPPEFRSVALNQDIVRRSNAVFSNELRSGKIKNQKQSNTCWINAGVSMLETTLISRGKISQEHEFSRNYILYYSLLEQSQNYFKKVIHKIATKQKEEIPLNQDKLGPIGVGEVSDSGDFGEFRYLVSKYGLPKEDHMPETQSSLNPALLVSDLNAYLGYSLSNMVDAYLSSPQINKEMSFLNWASLQRTELMQEVRKILNLHLGKPPRGKARFKTKIEDFVVLTSYPDRAYQKAYYPTELKNSPSSENEINLPIARLLELTKKSIDQGFAVWFSADHFRDTDYKTGIMSPEIYLRKKVYGFENNTAFENISRRKSYEFGISEPGHAMLITGYDQNPRTKKIQKLKVQNSWGPTYGKSGIFIMHKPWFLQNVFEIVVHKSLLSKKELLLLESID